MYDVKTRARELRRAERRSRHESDVVARRQADRVPASARVCRSGSRRRRAAAAACRMRPADAAAAAVAGARRAAAAAERPRRRRQRRRQARQRAGAAAGAPGGRTRPARGRGGGGGDGAAAATRRSPSQPGLYRATLPGGIDARADGRRTSRPARRRKSWHPGAGRSALQQHQRHHVGRRYVVFIFTQLAKQRPTNRNSYYSLSVSGDRARRCS